MNRTKAHRIVEYIRSCGGFCFECDEVVESLDEVLGFYGIYQVLDVDEYLEVVDELLGLAEEFEVAEAVRLTEQQVGPALMC